jgi:hypothetical protein
MKNNYLNDKMSDGKYNYIDKITVISIKDENIKLIYY